jgi:hypothetical protein
MLADIPDIMTNADVTRLFGPRGPAQERMFGATGLQPPGGPQRVTYYDLKGAHIVMAPQRPMLTVGAASTSEVFGHEVLGLLNVSNLHAIVDTAGDVAGEDFAISGSLRNYLTGANLDQSTLAQMTLARSEEPVYFLLSNGEMYLIDGHHRLSWRIDQGLERANGIVFREEMLPHIEVRLYGWRNVRRHWQRLTKEMMDASMGKLVR